MAIRALALELFSLEGPSQGGPSAFRRLESFDGRPSLKKRFRSRVLLKQILFRVLVGGSVVSAFSMLGDLFEPKSFAGLFGSAPSIALATLGLTLFAEGKSYASTEARSMTLGAIAFFLYASAVSRLMMHKNWPGKLAASVSLLLWFTAAFGLWFAILR